MKCVVGLLIEHPQDILASALYSLLSSQIKSPKLFLVLLKGLCERKAVKRPI